VEIDESGQAGVGPEIDFVCAGRYDHLRADRRNLLAGDRIYHLNQSGDCVVFRASPKFELIGANSIGNEMCNASLAVSNGEVFIRTHKHLWCISETKKSASVR
jgi:hypothetical protein